MSELTEDELDEIKSDLEESGIEDLTGESQTTEESELEDDLTHRLADNPAVGTIFPGETIRVGGDEPHIEAYIDTTKRGEKVRVGDYVFTEYTPEEQGTVTPLLFASVTSLEYRTKSTFNKNPSDSNMLKQEVNEDHYPMLAELNPITILRETEDELQRGAVDRVPRPHSNIWKMTKEEHLRTGLDLPLEGVPVGYLAVSGKPVPRSRDTPVIYNIRDPNDPLNAIEEPAIFTHALISGSTGQGKTQLTKNILRQYAGEEAPRYVIETETGQTTKKPNIFVIDPENEYAELHQDPEEKNLENPLSEYEDKGFATGGVDDCVAFIPDVQGTNANPTAATEEYTFSIPFSLVQGKPELLLPYDSSEATREAISTTLNQFFASNENLTYRNYINYLQQERERFVEIENRVHEASWVAMMNRIQQPIYSQIFDNSSQSVLDLEEEMFKPGRISVVPTKHLQGDKNQTIVLSILSHIVNNKLKSGDNVSDAIKNTPIIIALDEAHSYVSNTDNTQQAFIINQFTNVAKQGRKEKLGLALITQDPDDINEDIRSQINTRILLKLEQSTVNSIEAPREFERRIPRLSRGEAIIKAPDVQPVEVKALPDCLTLHSN